MNISVAICTWNRARLLDETLSAMALLVIPESVEWEILVVNNQCTDDTDAVIAKHSHNLPLRGLYESKQGHSHARNCALGAARGDLLIWTDDDVIVNPDWLSAYYKVSCLQPDAAFFGGPVQPWYEGAPPEWILRHVDLLRQVYALAEPGSTGRTIGPEECPVGANMAFRSSIAKQFQFNTSLGRMKASLVSGDEVDLVRRLQSAGYKGIWVPEAVLKHYVPMQRMTMRYLRDWNHGYGRTVVRAGNNLADKKLFGVPRWALRAYITAGAVSFFCVVIKSRRWMKSALRASYCRGIIEESRSLVRMPVSPAARTAGAPREVSA